MGVADQRQCLNAGPFVIPSRELLQLRAEWQIDVGVIEKDYILGWLLAGIANEPELAETWIFKGGTCLRKCYYETYRFSEDLDFTVIDDGPDMPEQLVSAFRRISDWVRDQSGIDLVVEENSFVTRKNRRGNPTCQGRIAYRGPQVDPGFPKVKIDVTSDELLVEDPAFRTVVHSYSDAPLPIEQIRCYSLTELFAEKLRALVERCRPRDLYDVVHVHRHPDLVGQAPLVLAALGQKCDFVGIPVPDAAAIESSPFRLEVEQEWANMLGHQLPKPLPPFGEFWQTLAAVFQWLAGGSVVLLPRADQRDLDPAWVAPKAIASWKRGIPLELVRYAGANRLKVEIDYRAERGRVGPRLVEPYSLRQTKEGNLLLFVVNDAGQLRGYRVDRIAGIRATDQIFRPRFLVEF